MRLPPNVPSYPNANPRLVSAVSVLGGWPGNWGRLEMRSFW